MKKIKFKIVCECCGEVLKIIEVPEEYLERFKADVKKKGWKLEEVPE